ncbi:bacteriocin immunity protein [Companilactobacillus mishanensis]|uniref:Bacteriocin immunity protein n=1 Tax=Companilactobacillus mishanensis TaxID=2486008 RepID=A0A5P0ZIL2_9LACO|nr:bacteriocin immunity protein [Companilactobacillus mishanensis]MQS52919.1 bacteriocin immunity protein [Companilactobacillus mishanensis]
MKTNKADELLKLVNADLELNITPFERETLLDAKKQLEKKDYLPKICGELRGAFTPLAMRRELSKDISDLYLKVVSGEFQDNRFGGGLGIVGHMF